MRTTINVRNDPADGTNIHNRSLCFNYERVKEVDHSHRPKYVDPEHLLDFLDISVSGCHCIADSTVPRILARK